MPYDIMSMALVDCAVHVTSVCGQTIDVDSTVYILGVLGVLGVLARARQERYRCLHW